MNHLCLGVLRGHSTMYCAVNVAMCWAAMLYHGRKGYVDATKGVISNARKLKKA